MLDRQDSEEEPERWKAARDKATRAPRRTVVVGAPAPVAASKPKKRSPVQQLLKVIRASKTCLIALEIEETAQDLRILRAIQSIPEDEIEMFFRDCGFTEETVLHIAELIQEGRPQIEELSTSILRRTWCLVIQILVFCIAMVLAVSGGFFAISLGYTGASCQFSDFTNGTLGARLLGGAGGLQDLPARQRLQAAGQVMSILEQRHQRVSDSPRPGVLAPCGGRVEACSTSAELGRRQDKPRCRQFLAPSRRYRRGSRVDNNGGPNKVRLGMNRRERSLRQVAAWYEGGIAYSSEPSTKQCQESTPRDRRKFTLLDFE
ncbi:ANKHD1 [Symbiodinium sp. CCMP2592]|nr:ANKHD1 [Symbiodinium sp. CCMP2592]